MIKFSLRSLSVEIGLPVKKAQNITSWLERNALFFIVGILSCISLACFIYFYQNGLGLAYNDARSHLDIGRRVVEGLKPGLAQLGSVWLPLPHLLMVPTIWNDFMWHSGLSGAIQSMISFVATGVIIYMFLKMLGVGLLGRLVGVFIFVANLNILYLQSIAMTELLLIVTMTAGVYQLTKWAKNEQLIDLIYAAFWIMLSTLVRYDGWFLLAFSAVLVFVRTIWKKGFKTAEGLFILFCTLAGFGIFLWLLWNKLIFNDALYFAFGPFSARSQQKQLEAAGVLESKGNLLLSLKIYWYALMFNSGAFTTLFAMLGAVGLWLDKRVNPYLRLGSTALIAPFLFNVIALYFGHSVLFIQGISGDTWFNARYGIMLAPSIAIFIGYIVHRLHILRAMLLGLLLFVTVFSFTSGDAVTIDDATVGSSQKNVTEVSGWLSDHVPGKEGFILISAASHDAIIFSSGLPMKRYIHEGTGAYWESAVEAPDRWARWIVMRTNDENDLVFKEIKDAPGFVKYVLVDSYPFADIYELKEEFLFDLNTKPVYKQK